MPALRARPNGFENVATESIQSLCRRYRCDTPQVKRWRNEIGVSVVPKTAKRAVRQVDRVGRVVARHKSIGAAAKSVNGYTQNIWKCLNGYIPTAYNFSWEYCDEQ